MKRSFRLFVAACTMYFVPQIVLASVAEEKIKVLQELAEEGIHGAYFELARLMLDSGDQGDAVALEQAESYLFRSAATGHASALRILGHSLYNRRDQNPDGSLAGLVYISLAAQLGDSTAKADLWQIANLIPSHKERALQAFLLAAGRLFTGQLISCKDSAQACSGVEGFRSAIPPEVHFAAKIIVQSQLDMASFEALLAEQISDHSYYTDRRRATYEKRIAQRQRTFQLKFGWPEIDELDRGVQPFTEYWLEGQRQDRSDWLKDQAADYFSRTSALDDHDTLLEMEQLLERINYHRRGKHRLTIEEMAELLRD